MRKLYLMLLAISTAAIVHAQPLSGTYTIDNAIANGGVNFSSFTNAVNALNTNGISGAVTFNVTAGQTFTEDVPVITATGTAANTITFQKSGTGNNPVIRPNGGAGTTDAGIAISGGDYFTFDGIDIIINTGSNVEFGYYVYNASDINGAQNNIVKNTAITLNKSNTTSRGIYQNVAITPTAASGANSNNKYLNLTIRNVYVGVQLTGNSTFPDLFCEVGNTSPTSFNNIGNPAIGNDIGNGGSSPSAGIRAMSQSGVKIYNNAISSVMVTGGVFVYGISLESGQGVCEIYRNKIQNIRSSSTSNASVVFGIRTDVISPNISNVYNNFITGFVHSRNAADATVIVRGISCNQGGGAGTNNIYHNTVVVNNVTTNAGAVNTNVSSAALDIRNGACVSRNNILINQSVGNVTTSKRFAVNRITAGTFTSDNNDLYVVTGTNNFIGFNGADQITLANWQASTGTPDLNSKNMEPVFLSATDLHLDHTNAANLANLNGMAATGTGVSNDIDDQVRDGSTPDIGADEIPASCATVTGGTASGSTAFCVSGTPTITATGYTPGAIGITYQWYSSSLLADYPNGGTAVSGQTNPTALTTGVVSSTTYYWLRVTCTTSSASDNSTLVTITIDPTSVGGTASSDQTICSGSSPADITLTGNTGNVVRWEYSTDAAFTTPVTIANTTTTLTSAQMGTLTADRWYRAVVKSGACSIANSTSVKVTVNPTSVGGTANSDQTICSGSSPADIILTGNTGNVIRWEYSTDAAFTAPVTIANTTTTLTSSEMGALTADRWFRAVVQSGLCANANSAAVKMTVTPNVTPTFSFGTTLTICSGGSVPTLPGTSDNTITGTWSPATVSNTSSDTYTFTPTPGQCATTATFTVTVNTGAGWANLQWPASGSINTCGTYDVYGQVYKAGVTEAPGQGAGIAAELGWSTSNTNPNTWTNWQPASFNVQVGNNDEYVSTLSNLLPGTYYYAYRYQVSPCSYQYGGYSAGGGGFWDGSTYISGVLTVTAPVSLAASPGGGASCQNVAVGNGKLFTDGSCLAIAKIIPGGASPVTGIVNACVTIDATVQTYNNQAYLQRHFDITPASNPATSTARITLYVLQGEFDAFNANNGAYPDLPTGPADAAGIANLRITKYGGTGTAPGTYTGTATMIDPADGDIVWNGAYWEISFDVTGFSGFYIHTSQGMGALPVELLSFSGFKAGTRNQLRWVTASETNNRGFDVQRSTDGVNYRSIGYVNSLAAGGNSSENLPYTFTDANPAGTQQYYRLKQEDLNGQTRMSSVVLIRGAMTSDLAIEGLFPNPASGTVNVRVGAPATMRITLQVTDFAGRALFQKQVTVAPGSNTVSLETAALANGTYIVRIVSESGVTSQPHKLIKQ